MYQPQIFNFEQSEVRTVLVNDEPYFVGKDVAEVLGYSNTRDALAKRVDEEDKGVANCDTLGGKQDLVIINESGLYSLIISSKLPSAKKFKRWVTSEVLPTIRKTGGYQTPANPRDQLRIMYQFQEDTAERVDDLEKDVNKLKTEQPIAPGDYSYIGTRITQRVNEVAKGFGKLTSKQRGELYRDINSGVKKITGVGSRTQLRKHHYQMVVDYIQDWEPATATKTILRQMSLELGNE